VEESYICTVSFDKGWLKVAYNFTGKQFYVSYQARGWKDATIIGHFDGFGDAMQFISEELVKTCEPLRTSLGIIDGP